MSGGNDLFTELQERQAQAMQAYQDSVSQTMKAWQDAFSPSDGSAEPANVFDPTTLIDNYFEFANDMLKRQHEFTMKMVDAMKLPGAGN
ncbi:MAG: hypothetical protein ACK5RL_06645 [Acidimicrobiales bacterium]